MYSLAIKWIIKVKFQDFMPKRTLLVLGVGSFFLGRGPLMLLTFHAGFPIYSSLLVNIFVFLLLFFFLFVRKS